MAFRAELTPKARQELADLPRNIQKRIIRRLDLLADDPRRTGTKQLQGHPELRRVHAGKDYVIVYTIRRKKLIVLVVRISHRSKVYRKL